MLTNLYCWVVSRFRSEEGATAVEYGVMVSLIAVAIILLVTAVGDQLNVVFQKVVTALGGV